MSEIKKKPVVCYTVFVMLILFLSLAGGAPAAEPGQWVFLGEGNAGDAWFIDKESITQVSKNTARARVKAEFKRPGLFQEKQPVRQSTLIEWECPGRKHRTIETVLQFTDGARSTAKGAPDKSAVPPPIVLDSLYLYLCSGDAGCVQKSPACPE
ncbi:MAG: hypothetical protein ACM3ON_00240 [Chloroflexota bacterium]